MKKIINFLFSSWVIIFLALVYLFIGFWGTRVTQFFASPEFQKQLGQAFYSGWLGLVDYLSAHVLFCLIPAFFIAGAINSLIDRQTVLQYLSGKTKKWLAYLIAAGGGFLIEVCSCTILPLFAGIWKKGAGLGVAIILLYAGPAFNILAVLLTGQRLGWSLALWRLALSFSFSLIIGFLMEAIFGSGREDGGLTILEQNETGLKGIKAFVFWANLLVILVAGTAPLSSGLKQALVLGLSAFQLVISFLWLNSNQLYSWWQETMKFMTQIIPLLLAGVFGAAFITHLIPKQQFQALTKTNNLVTNLAAVVFGAVAYFPALVEVPIAENFARLGMNKGPLMAYLLADPVLSLQGLLIISRFIGTKKTLVYLSLTVLLTTLAGWLYGLLL